MAMTGYCVATKNLVRELRYVAQQSVLTYRVRCGIQREISFLLQLCLSQHHRRMLLQHSTEHHIFRNYGSSHQWFSLIQKVPFDHSKGLEVFEFGDLSELYLTTWNETRIQIYKLEGESGLKPSFTLHGKCIKDVKPLEIDGDIYLAVGQQNLKNGPAVRSVLYKGLTKGVRYTPHNFKNC
ncbi:uncharacterized protein TNIN_217781 [Trichonephila inaurata madagascariensis]|uniref:Uncharacterized protein n=1 Tax=Trichonephila inaurata madagascariensis TaxID=2747483 RepID=A0A8X7C5J1_9ARAC|nr:uncharacterized protein TNIN_217781 [Trichonephila inaurata madagascariensis]